MVWHLILGKGGYSTAYVVSISLFRLRCVWTSHVNSANSTWQTIYYLLLESIYKRATKKVHNASPSACTVCDVVIQCERVQTIIIIGRRMPFIHQMSPQKCYTKLGIFAWGLSRFHHQECVFRFRICSGKLPLALLRAFAKGLCSPALRAIMDCP